MSTESPIPPHRILSALADLAPGSKPSVNHRITDRMLLPFDAVSLFSRSAVRPPPVHNGAPDSAARRIERFVKRARLHDDEDLLRVGWLWVTGDGPDGEPVRFPLVTMRIHANPRVVQWLLSDAAPVRRGEPELTDLITDPSTRARLESTANFATGVYDGLGNDHLDAALLERLPQLRDWAVEAADAAGYSTQRLIEREVRGSTELSVVAQVALYIGEAQSTSATIASTLRSWPESSAQESAFAAIYSDNPDAEHDRDEPVWSSMVLTAAQRDIVRASRNAPVTVVSGPPGTGKTQTVAAVALDAVERGESVLVAAPGTAAIEALITLLTEMPGPDPVVFGATEQRRAVADRLGQGGGRLVDRRAAAEAERRHREADTKYRNVVASTSALLHAEQLADEGDPTLTLDSRSIAPCWFDQGSDLGAAQRTIDDVARTRGWFAGFRRRRKLVAVRSHAGGASDDLDEFRSALADARASQALAELERAGGLDLSNTWDRIAATDEDRRRRKGEWLNAIAHASSRIGRTTRSTMAAVSAALRSGRAGRREQLGKLDGRAVVDALPLWIGTLRDIDDLLPRTGAMFDIVVIDEASQVDQVAAAAALLRANRTVVVGDPKQLRHVSFLSDDRVAAALAANEINVEETVHRLDVRRLSLFDLAAASARTRFLDEHFRSAPHLIGFSARRFYGGELTIATTHPRIDDVDCIDVEFVAGERGSNGVNEIEVATVLDRLRGHLAARRSGTTSGTIGVVSPFRDQVDAIESAVIDEFSLDDIDELGLRVGTVHGFQGCERDIVLISLAIDPTSSPGSRSFLGDPNLFNVMITRARERILVVTSLDHETGGIVGDYLRHGAEPPPTPRGERGRSPRADAIAGELGRSGIDSVVGYRSGRHVVDLVVGNDANALGVIFGVHRDGPAAHIERRLSLHRQGWDVFEVFESKWHDRHADLAVEIALQAQRRT